MAAHARDTPSENTPAATYFGGWERLSGHLGYPKHDGAAERATARAVAELLASGLAENVGRLQPGRGPRLYLLHLGGAWP
jgi:hypothetical protein